MPHGVATNRKVLAIGLGALLAPVLLSGATSAASDHHPGDGIAPIPPVAPLQFVLLARGSAGEFAIADEEIGFHLRATEPTDVVVVQVTGQPHTSTGWHTHAGPSMVVLVSGEARLIEPKEGGRGCTEETFSAGDSYVHPSGTHLVANDGDEPVSAYIIYFVPEEASPALVPADPPRGCPSPEGERHSS
jgi:quercetin dioxygenase-like cupin family protein